LTSRRKRFNILPMQEAPKFGQYFTKEAYEKFLPCWEFAQEVEAVLANPERLRTYFSVSPSDIESRQDLHLAKALIYGNFIPREGYYLPGLRERITDEDMEETRKALPQLSQHLDSLIESLKNEKMTLGGYIDQGQTEEYKSKLHLVFGIIMFSREITSEMLELLEDLTHLLSGQEFATLFSLHVLYSEEAGRRMYNGERD